MIWTIVSTVVPTHDVFDWFASIWIPAGVGVTSLSVAAASWWAARTANRIAREADERERSRGLRQERFEFAQRLLHYLERRDLESAKNSQWATVLSSSEDTWEIVSWAVSQVPDSPALRDLATITVQGRLQAWVKTGDFDFSDVLLPDIRTMGL